MRDAVMVAVMALTPVHMQDHGSELRIIGITISLHIAGMFALSPVMGWISDRIGPMPTILAGQITLVHETMDQVKEPRRAWQYNAGQRRVRRAPQVAYDSPGTAADGLRTTDNYDLYNGAPDRYEWKLKGKKEMYIPYNAYRLANNKLTYKEIHQP